jgi:hypothetical protein
MSLPPSALYSPSGVSYNCFDTCLYSVVGALPANAPTPANAILPFDSGAGQTASNFFVNFGKDVGLKPNRKVPVQNTEPLVGSIVNTKSQPVFFSGNAGVYVVGGAFDAGEFLVKYHPAGIDVGNAIIIGTVYTIASEPLVNIPFSVVLNAGDSIFCECVIQQTQTCGVKLDNVRATTVYGAFGTIDAGYIPA